LVLGSATPELLRQSSESLAGRIAYYTLDGFAIDEVGTRKLNSLWLRGGFPVSFLARSNDASWKWRNNFLRSFIERDLPQLGVRVPGSTLHRFWSMLAHYHGQTWNASAFARSFGVTDKTVTHYLDVLVSSLVVRTLAPWHENVRKRQVKAPKVYLRDSGMLHALLGIRDKRDLERHPKLGASWEGFVLDQLIQHIGVTPEECFFWATHSGAELDLLCVRGRKRIGFEIKRTSAPKLTRSMQTAMDDLKLKKAYVVHAGKNTFRLSQKVNAVAAERILDDLEGSI
jgi:predicted AAA+ superfamily ATPase